MSTPWTLEIDCSVEDGLVVLALAGRLGTDSADRLTRAITDVLRDGRQRVLLDLGRVDYLSSAGLRALDGAAGRLREAGGNMVLCAPGDPVRLVLELAGLPVVVEASREAGLDRLARE